MRTTLPFLPRGKENLRCAQLPGAFRHAQPGYVDAFVMYKELAFL
jgi:hypothetical protein